MEENYRSTQLILDAAHGIITHNTQRKEKRLWTENTSGTKVAVEVLDDEETEADWVAETIAKLLKEGIAPNELAVFYRVNSLSRSMERALMENEFIHHTAMAYGHHGAALIEACKYVPGLEPVRLNETP